MLQNQFLKINKKLRRLKRPPVTLDCQSCFKQSKKLYHNITNVHISTCSLDEYSTLFRNHYSIKVVLVVKNLSANAGDTRDLGQEDLLEKGMTSHSSSLA